MLRRPQPLFPFQVHRDIYTVLFPNLSFKDLTSLAENRLLESDLQMEAERTLKKEYTFYSNLKGAYCRRDFVTLIDNLVARVAPLLNYPRSFTIYPKTESTYKKLLTDVGPFLGFLIGSRLFSNSVHHQLNPVIVHDLVFHYCRFNPQGAGELLNRNILKLWSPGNRYVVNYLIEYGARVNAVYNDSPSTLFHAVTYNSSEELIRKLIAHGASYTSYDETRHGVRYTLMLITALNHNLEALTVLVEKFPGQVAATLETLDQMLIMIRNSNTQFTSEHGVFKPYTWEGKPIQPFYTVDQIELAKEVIQQLISEKNHAQEAKSTPTQAAATAGVGSGHPAGLFPAPAAAPPQAAQPQPSSVCAMALS